MERLYYIASGKENLGPFSLTELKDKDIKSNTLVWYEGLGHWTEAKDIEELKTIIPSIILPPMNPMQNMEMEKKIKFMILKRIITKCMKKATILFSIIFAIQIIIYLILSDNVDLQQYLRSSDVYTSSKNEVWSILLFSSFIISLAMSLISLPIFYFIENQKPYKGLIACTDEKENEIYLELVKRQEQKYNYDKGIDESLCVIGYIMLILNLIFGFFPEFKILDDSYDGEMTILLIGIGFRVMGIILVLFLTETKNRASSWGLLALLFPSITLIIVSSLYPIRKTEATEKAEKRNVCPECGYFKYIDEECCSNCRSNEEKIQE